MKSVYQSNLTLLVTMELKDLLAPNQLFALLAKGIDGLKIIAINVLIARYFGPEIYGKFAFVIGIVSLVAIVSEFRMQTVLSRELSVVGKGSYSTILNAAFFVNLIFAFLGVFLFVVYIYIEPDDTVAFAALICSFSYLFKIVRFLRAFFVSREQNVFIAISEFVASLITLLIVFFAVINDVEWEYLPLLRTLDYLIASLLFLFFFYKYFNVSISVFGVDRKVAKNLIVKSSPLVLSGVAMLLFQRMDILMIKALLSDSSVGLYSAASNFMMLFSLAPMVLSESLGPKLFRGAKCAEETMLIKRRFLLGIMSLGLLFSVSLYFIGDFMIPVLYGSQYSESLDAHLFLSFCPFFVSAGAAAGQMIVADETQGKAYIKSVYACVINFILNLWLIPIYGIAGAAFSTVMGFVIANFIGHWFVADYRYIFKMQAAFFTPLYIKGKGNA